MKLFIAALILGLAIEGASMALFPAFMRKALMQIASLTDRELRQTGIFALTVSICFAWLLGFAS